MLRLWLLSAPFTGRAARGAVRRVSSATLNAVPPPKTRNIGIIAHIDAGKTTTTERMLFFSGRTTRMGNVDQGDTVTDYLPLERQRGITIQLAAITLPWHGHKINVIDTPGHADFTFEVTRSLRVLDGAVTILDAVAGVEAQTEKVWRQAAALQVPRVAYVNKMDRPGAGFGRTVKELVAKLQTRAVCVNLPYFAGPETAPVFSGVVDVVHQKLLVWDAGETAVVDLALGAGLSPEFAAAREHMARSREAMVETLGDLDDTVIEEFLECGEDYLAVGAATLQAAIRRATLANELTPVLCGLSFRNIGVQPLMDAVVAYLPSPLEAPIPELTATTTQKLGKRRNKHAVAQTVDVAVAKDPQRGLVVAQKPQLTVLLAFKVITSPARGVMAFFRVYLGRLVLNLVVVNTRTGKRLHLKRLMLMHGDQPEEVASVAAGNIGVVAGTGDDLVTGDTFVSQGPSMGKAFSETEAALRLHAIEVPPPLFRASLEPATAGDARHALECIKVLLREDPSVRVHHDEDMGQTVLAGMGELHLEIVRDRLVQDMKARVALKDVAVLYKESVARPQPLVRVVSPDNPLVFVEISLDSFEGAAAAQPAADEDGAVLLDDNNIVVMPGSAVAPDTLAAHTNRRWKCEQTLDELAETVLRGCATGLQLGGPQHGLAMHSCVVRVLGWLFPAEDKDVPVAGLLEASWRAVARAVADAHAQGLLCVLEPIMETRVTVDLDVLGDVLHDLTARCNATILAIDDDSGGLAAEGWALAEAEKIYVPPDYTMQAGGFAIHNRKTILAETPLREMVGYLLRLRSMTQGRGAFDMSYLGMRRAPPARVQAIRELS